MKAKHLKLQVVHLNMNIDDRPAPSPNPRPFDPEKLPVVGGQLHATRIPHGMQSGKTAVFLQFDLDDGSSLLVECSLALLDSIPRAFHARDEAEGRPSSR